jgi:hypothetical protein
VTVNLRNPEALLNEWRASAAEAEAASQDGLAKANEQHAAAVQHQRQAGEAAGEEMRLMQELSEARQRREYHEQQNNTAMSNAEQFAQSAKTCEDRAADLRTAIGAFQQGQGAGPIALDPTAETRLDGTMARFNGAHDEHDAETGEQAVAS